MRAMVFSSGASTIAMKSKCPSVADWALTVAPSCSTSLLTSRMRAGLFLAVWTPSGVSVESMMYVGTGLPPWLAGGARARCIRSFPPRAVFREPDAPTAPDPRGRRRGPAHLPGRPGGGDRVARPVLPLGRRADARVGARAGVRLHPGRGGHRED